MTAQTMHLSEAQLRAALTDLAARYKAIASRATTAPGRQRAKQIRQAGEDIQHVLATGHVPAYLITDSAPEGQAAS